VQNLASPAMAELGIQRLLTVQFVLDSSAMASSSPFRLPKVFCALCLIGVFLLPTWLIGHRET
jgi:hypothetical protein